jgi:hypothetical protein
MIHIFNFFYEFLNAFFRNVTALYMMRYEGK